MNDVCIFAVLKQPPSYDGRELKSLPVSVRWLEVRADLAGEISKTWLANHFSGQVLYTLRSKSEGGQFAGSNEERSERLRHAAKYYDLIDLEQDDLEAENHNHVPPGQRVISWQGHAQSARELLATFDKMRRVEAHLYRLVSRAERLADGLAPLALLHTLGRRDVVAYADGPVGPWCRVLAPRLGAPAVFGTLAEPVAGEAEPSVRQLIEDYGFPARRKPERLFGIVGGHVNQSLSPRFHNAAYRALGIPALFVPFSVPSFDDFWQCIPQGDLLSRWQMPLNGFSLTAPHKEAAFKLSQSGSPLTQCASAANIMRRSVRGWQAESADGDGVLLSLRARHISLKSRRVAVLGCGGSGRVVAAALHAEGAQVTLVNRTEERGRRAAAALGLAFLPLASLRPEDFSILVNATSAGRTTEELPFAVRRLDTASVVIDFSYREAPTALVSSVRHRGGIAIDGREILYHQLRRHFQFMTGQELPGELIKELLGSSAGLSWPRASAAFA